MLNDQHIGLGGRRVDAPCVERSFNDGLGAAHVRALMVLAKAVSSGALGAVVMGTLWFGYILVSAGR